VPNYDIEGGDATFSAGNKISLLPGFIVERGGHFLGTVFGLEGGANALSKMTGKDNITALALADQLHLITVVPNEFGLSQNYPNPFNPTTTIKYALPTDSHVSLKIYNMLGQLVITLVNEEQTPGYREVVWDGRNKAGAMVTSGMYIYRIVAGNFIKTQKMTFVK
jgi:hypothetical protein